MTASLSPDVTMAVWAPWEPETKISLHMSERSSAVIHRAGNEPCGPNGQLAWPHGGGGRGNSDFDLSPKQFILSDTEIHHII